MSTFVAAVVMFGAALTFAPQHAAATPAFAQKTGKACGSCHVSKSGGGALTSAGKAFQKKTNSAATGVTITGKNGITSTTARRHSPYRRG